MIAQRGRYTDSMYAPAPDMTTMIQHHVWDAGMAVKERADVSRYVAQVVVQKALVSFSKVQCISVKVNDSQ